MEGRVCFEYRWGLKPVPAYALCHTKPIFDSDYHNKRPNTPNKMPSRKRSNTCWSTNTFVPSVAICIARIIWHRLSAAICIGRPICLYSSVAICIDRSICHRWKQQYVLVNQYVIQNRQQYALITPICHQVQYDLQNILKFISYCPRYGSFHKELTLFAEYFGFGDVFTDTREVRSIIASFH